MKSDRPIRSLAAALIAATFIHSALVGCSGKTEPAASSNPPPAEAPPAATNGATTPDTSAASGATAASGEVSLELGQKVFKQRCALCHGPDGHGNGPASASLNPKPRNFHDATYMHSRTDEQLLTVIHNGKGAMPVWKKVLSEVEMKSALMYVRTFAGKP